jgi:arginase
MSLTRREFTLNACAAALTGFGPGTPGPQAKRISLVLAPSNLGLRPTENGGQPGAWRAPQVLMDAGLARALDAEQIIRLERPNYAFGPQAGTRIRNGQSIRAFSLQLAEKVRGILEKHGFPVIVGGDCSILLGCLHGLRLGGGRGLVHIDGHSDFYQLGNEATAKILGAVAGMDLALASGRGEPLLTHWRDVDMPLVTDADIIQVGEREAPASNSISGYGRIPNTEITQFTAQNVLAEGIEAVARRVIVKLEIRKLDSVWLHVDLDVLDQTVMPAVDSPGSPGLTYAQLAGFVCALCGSGRVAGIDFAIYDPDRDPFARYARPLVQCLADAVCVRPIAHAV